MSQIDLFKDYSYSIRLWGKKKIQWHKNVNIYVQWMWFPNLLAYNFLDGWYAIKNQSIISIYFHENDNRIP